MEARDSVPSVRRPRPALFRVAARDPRGVREDVDSAASTDGAGWDRPPLRSSPGAAQGRVQPDGLGAGAVSSFGCAVEMGRSERAAHRTRRVTCAPLLPSYQARPCFCGRRQRLKKAALLDNSLDNMTTKGRHFWRPLFLQLTDSKGGAEEGIRTPTVLLPPAPQAGASASSATSASGTISESLIPDPGFTSSVSAPEQPGLSRRSARSQGLAGRTRRG